MDNTRFYLRVAYIIILITMTICYISGDVVKNWWSWFSGFAYSLALTGLLNTFDRRRKGK